VGTDAGGDGDGERKKKEGGMLRFQQEDLVQYSPSWGKLNTKPSTPQFVKISVY
jgi:hypothetical protein